MVIEKYPDKIVIANPDTIITGKKHMLKGGISQPRNKGLFKVFNLIGLGEHVGSGIPDIFLALKEVGLEEPAVEEKFGIPDQTTLTLSLFQSETYSLGTSLVTSDEVGDEANKKKIIAFCDEPRSKAEIQKYLCIKSERYTRQRLIMPLLSGGRLDRTYTRKTK